MPRCVTVTGVVGSLRWGYHPAGDLADWTVTKGAEGAWTLTARVVLTDAFRVSQRPLVFVAPHQDGSWRWPIQELQIVDGTLSASLSPPEK